MQILIMETKSILRKTNVVDNGQIAAVELDGNVTLKTFRKMGSTNFANSGK